MKTIFKYLPAFALPIMMALFMLEMVFYNEAPVQTSGVLRGDVDVTSKHKSLHLEIADTPELRLKGLRGHPPLEDGEGLILVFDQPEKVCLWNKGVLFPVSVAILDENKHMIAQGSMNADSEKKVCSPVATRYVIEAKLGVFDKFKEN